MTASDLTTLSDRQLDDARRDIGAIKLRIRRATNLRPILFRMEQVGESWYYEQGELRCRPDWKPPINPAHAALIAQVRTLNRQLEDLNRETEDRQRKAWAHRSRKPARPVS